MLWSSLSTKMHSSSIIRSCSAATSSLVWATLVMMSKDEERQGGQMKKQWTASQECAAECFKTCSQCCLLVAYVNCWSAVVRSLSLCVSMSRNAAATGRNTSNWWIAVQSIIPLLKASQTSSRLFLPQTLLTVRAGQSVHTTEAITHDLLHYIHSLQARRWACPPEANFIIQQHIT